MYSIGRVAQETGVKVPTIRYYEQIGLLPEPDRSAGRQRLYTPRTVERLAFIRHARELGFPLPAIRDLLSLSDQPDRPCEAADAIAVEQLGQVERRLNQLQALKQELSRMIVQCRGGSISECRIIEVLSDHSQCEAKSHAGL
ncbi:MerR family transcriptional regulator [Oceanibaculum pacificum]|uniref:MerR family transcriptional regulator n=1 Tax=Oceanibaculum pacificum TaxID=580166 RepID=A0A154WFX7_9PROT|nr:helix-turn-helix domain-containing protein [Oceanibaculum pacificum]KZD12399.1 MerR family transcriptional regulator [Oceanibaculum pacificum]